MCVIFFSYNNHPYYKLLLAGNRDEFYTRKTLKMQWWKDHQNLLAGKDLEKGGTWLSITKNGRFAALTNFRDFHNPKVNGITRGRLALDFLVNNYSSADYIDNISQKDNLDGYNLLVFDGNNLIFHSNKTNTTENLQPGIYGISNASLDTPWPKVVMGKKMESVNKKIDI